MGLTRACVGRPCCSGSGSQLWWAHPRVCGPSLAASESRTIFMGSPLRAWAVRPRRVPRGRRPGLTLACVGRPPGPVPARTVPRAHPCVRGPSSNCQLSCFLRKGSPLRAWAVQGLAGEPEGEFGLTLACVGRPLRDLGEHRRAGYRRFSLAGSGYAIGGGEQPIARLR